MVIESKNIQDGFEGFENRLLQICDRKDQEFRNKFKDKVFLMEKILKLASKDKMYIVSK
ncbi:MAG: hypothetical protein AB201_02995 [Parcubacteria bacterium C7867-006]|nr:MAG: hypothetical protein AB201_02995 [Parcubacteria bacterium C7867-006]